mgnify:CR=1 FL=1
MLTLLENRPFLTESGAADGQRAFGPVACEGKGTLGLDAASGGRISRDPIEEAGGLNLYGYVGGDPINRVDPLGLAWPFGTSPEDSPNPITPSPEPSPSSMLNITVQPLLKECNYTCTLDSMSGTECPSGFKVGVTTTAKTKIVLITTECPDPYSVTETK